jgi:hypothetical protein
MYSILYVDDEEALLDIGKIFLEKDRTMAVYSLHLPNPSPVQPLFADSGDLFPV